MTNIRRILLPSLTILALACSAQRPQIASMPPDVRADWDRCEAAVTRWCADHSHGSPTEERDCVQTESQNFARQADEAARRAYLGAHGCTP